MLFLIYSTILITIFIHSVWDYEHIKAGFRIWHITENVILTAALAIVFYCITFSFKETVGYLLLYAGIRWLLFDLILNRLRGLPWLYSSKYSAVQSLSDRFLNHFSPKWFLLIKIAVLVIITIFVGTILNVKVL